MNSGGNVQQAEIQIPVRFVADVHLIDILGEQLIGSEKVGILELIKNAYDAGAARCDVWIEKVPGLPAVALSDPDLDELPGPVVTVVDDGCGMNQETIINGWLRPATRIKTSIKDRLQKERTEADRRGTRDEYDRLVATLKLEHGGRLPLGEKGVGRFAAHRLGRYLILQTKAKEEPYEWVLHIDWEDFNPPDDKPLDLDKIALSLIRRNPQRDYGPTDSGTLLRIYGARKGFKWTEDTLREVGQAVALLRSPTKMRDPNRFAVQFHCPQLSGEKFEVPTQTVPPALTCVAIVDEDGSADIEIKLTPPASLSVPIAPQRWTESIDLRAASPAERKNYWRSSGPRSPLRRPECGPFTVDIHFWFRVGEWIDAPDTKQFTDYLEEFGGIGIYRDGLSIVPAQYISRTDLLRLSARHIKKGIHISYYNMSGSVDLVQEKTLNLVDRTSREGMLDTQAFRDLTELVRTIVFRLEFRVTETRDRYRKLKEGSVPSKADLASRAKTVAQVMTNIRSYYDFAKDELGLTRIPGLQDDPKKTIALVTDASTDVLRYVETLTDQADSLAEAAGYGIAIAVAVHEIEKITANLYFRLEQLCRKLSRPSDRELYDQCAELTRVARSLTEELKRLAPLRVTRLERRREFSVRDAVLLATGAFTLAWRDLNVVFFPPTAETDFRVYGSFGACSQVLANLFDNATYWLRAVDPDKRRVIVQTYPAERKVVVADSGPGIDEKMRPHLFELYYSLKNPPSGLGLYICRYYMRQMRGGIREAHPSERLPGFAGAQFVLTFPKIEKQGEE